MIIYPSKKLKYISVLLIIFFIPNFITDKFGIHPGFTGHTVTINMIPDMNIKRDVPIVLGNMKIIMMVILMLEEQ